MKKVMFSVTTLYGGGAERVVTVWANELVATGYDISILIYGRTENEYFVDPKIKICTVADNYNEYKKMSYFKRLQKMRNIVKEIGADVIINFLPRMQIWMLIATLGLKIYRIETVRVNPWIICRNNKVEKLLWKACLYRANKIIIQTSEQKEYFNELLKKKCCVISNPISKQCYEYEKIKYDQVAKNFIAVGRITPQKNYEMMIHAFKIVQRKKKDIRLHIFGEGEEKYKASLIKLIDELELTENVFFKGRSNNIPNELNKSDVFLMTSLYEGMPNALLEAMTIGLVCISTNCKTGPKDIIREGENGFLVDVQDTEMFAKRILKILQMDATEMARIGENAKKTISILCSSEKSRNKLINLIEDNS